MSEKKTLTFKRKRIAISALPDFPENQNDRTILLDRLLSRFFFLKSKCDDATGKEIAEFLIENDLVTTMEKIALEKVLVQWSSWNNFLEKLQEEAITRQAKFESDRLTFFEKFYDAPMPVDEMTDIQKKAHSKRIASKNWSFVIWGVLLLVAFSIARCANNIDSDPYQDQADDYFESIGIDR